MPGHRKRFILTVLSLFLGLETFLWAVVITSGSDYAHVIEQRPDFLIAGSSALMPVERDTEKNIRRGTPVRIRC